LLALRAEHEWAQMDAVQQYSTRIAVVPVQVEEPVGIAALRTLIKPPIAGI
jgi:hypothetical protein